MSVAESPARRADGLLKHLALIKLNSMASQQLKELGLIVEATSFQGLKTLATCALRAGKTISQPLIRLCFRHRGDTITLLGLPGRIGD
jgi:hypothetical protein